VKTITLTAMALAAIGAAYAQGASVPIAPPPAAAPKPAIPSPPPSATGPAAGPVAEVSSPAPPSGGSSLLMRGLDKLTGRPTNIIAPIGRPVQFATLTITARFCYSTPASETPETAAFVQIEDHRPDQTARRIFSGWMYGSSPGLNGVEHPLYDVWAISCNNTAAPALAAATASTAPVKVKAPDSSDKEGIQALPEGASQ
jgi:hypothetical protein